MFHSVSIFSLVVFHSVVWLPSLNVKFMPCRGWDNSKDRERDRNSRGEASPSSCCPAAMQCLANMTKSLSELVANHMHKLLEPLFSNGLSPHVSPTILVAA